MRCVQIVGDYGKSFHAGPKAQRDVTAILEREGCEPFIVKRSTFCNGFAGKMLARLVWAVECRRLKAKLPANCTIFMQYPSAAWSKNPALRVLNEVIKRRRRIRLVALFHDFASLRWKDDSLENGQLARDEADLLALADVAIVHNEAMKAALVKRGIPAEKMITLEVFDYLTPCCQRLNRKLEDAVVIAGNLNPDKAGYLDGLASISGANWNLYGVQFNPARLKGDNVRFLGCYSPEELPGKLEGSFGLIWDGPSVEECRGALGNYLRINNPHKLSLYLASGLPVFIWARAAEANFVKAYDVGVCIGSIAEIPSVLANMSAERYEQLVRNVMAQSKLLREGHFLKTAIGRALCEGERHAGL